MRERIAGRDIRTNWHAHGVKSTPELAELLGVTLPPHMRPRRRQLYAHLVNTTLSFKQIAKRLHMSHCAIYSLAHSIYKQFNVSGKGARKRLKEKAGVAGGTGKKIMLRMAEKPQWSPTQIGTSVVAPRR